MKKIGCLLIILLFVLPLFTEKKTKGKKGALEYQSEKGYKELNPIHKRWLDMVAYIATNDEKRIFLRLNSPGERDLYIKFFWDQRDPTPGTTDNEYKNEIKKRFKYVNSYFKRGTPKPGWKTDMGRVHMILGEPNSIETFDNQPGLYPAQVWYYYGDKKLGLPTYFNITFYKPYGTGGWVYYDPVSDGPSALIIDTLEMDSTNFRSLYRKIQKLSPNLAGPSVSMIPSQIPYAFKPSLRNTMIMSNVYKSPTKKINTSYATNFLKYRGFVDVDSSVNYIENSHLVAVLKDTRFPYNFVNITVKPKKISVDFNQEKDKYYFNFNLVVSLRKYEQIIYQYTKNFDYYLDADKLDILKASGIVIHDYFPVIPGKYKVVVFIENQVKKEFSYFDKDLNIQPAGSVPYLAQPLFGYEKKKQPNNFFFAYKVNNIKLSVDTENNFPLGQFPFILVGVYNLNEKTWEKGRVEWELKGLSERNNFQKKGTISLKDQPFVKNINNILQIPEKNLNYDYYELTLRLFNHAGILIDTRGAEFSISPFKNLPRPTEMYSQHLMNNPFHFEYVLGNQFRKTGQLIEAEKRFKKSIIYNPAFLESLLALLETQVQLKKYSEVLEQVERLKDVKKYAFNYHQIKGEALFGLQMYKEALNEFLTSNKIYNSDVRLINMIGNTYIKMGDQKEALKTFEASILINDQQPLIKQIIQELKKK